MDRSRTSNGYNLGKSLHCEAHRLLSRTAGEVLQTAYSIIDKDSQTRNRSPWGMVVFPENYMGFIGERKDSGQVHTFVIMCSQK